MMLGVMMVLVYISRFAPTRKEFEENQNSKAGGGQ